MLFRYSTNSNGQPEKKAVVYTKEEHGILKYKIDSDALKIVRILREAGYQSYIVGGAVRDLIIGKAPKDFDIVTNATPSRIKKLFRTSRIIGRRFRLVHVIYGSRIYEVCTFRSICSGSVGNNFGTIEEDVMRRDFSLNALYYDPIKEQVIDYVGGVKDIKKGILRPVIPMKRIFIEDPVRMLRAIKYATTTKCRMPFYLKHKIRKSAHLLSPVSPSRLTEEMLKILSSGHSYDIVKAALDTDLYVYLQPTATSIMHENKNFEKNYLGNLKKLDKLLETEVDARLGKKLFYIVFDFISKMTDWKKEQKNSDIAGELYTKTWTECRQFVLPMNPQRTELEYAIRASLTELGVSVHKQRKRNRRKVTEKK